MTFHFPPSGPRMAGVMNFVRMSASVSSFLFMRLISYAVDEPRVDLRASAMRPLRLSPSLLVQRKNCVRVADSPRNLTSRRKEPARSSHPEEPNLVTSAAEE